MIVAFVFQLGFDPDDNPCLSKQRVTEALFEIDGVTKANRIGDVFEIVVDYYTELYNFDIEGLEGVELCLKAKLNEGLDRCFRDAEIDVKGETYVIDRMPITSATAPLYYMKGVDSNRKLHIGKAALILAVQDRNARLGEECENAEKAWKEHTQ